MFPSLILYAFRVEFYLPGRGLPVGPTGPEVGLTVGLPAGPTDVGFTVGLSVGPTGPKVGFTIGLLTPYTIC